MYDFIREFWEGQGKTHGAAPEASWGDTYAIALEVEAIGRHLADGQEVLDVGCANGHATFRQWGLRKLKRLVGIDYSVSMIEAARRAQSDSGARPGLEFQVGDVLGLDFPEATFDVVYTTRVLINLPRWQDQIRGLEECLRVARPGGTVVLSEAFWEPLVLLNSFRALKGLPPLVEHDFNRYLKKARLERLLQERGLRYEVDDFSSIYYLGSRFLRELVTEHEKWPGYSNPINQAFFELENRFSGGGFGVQQAFAIRKAASA